MKSLKGTRTENNLLTAFAGESQARNRYNYFASAAKKEGYVQIANIFAETADNEKEHAKRFFKFLEGGDVEITAPFPAGIIADTKENLRAAAAGENHEHSTLYPEFARIAEEEGFNEIAAVFRAETGKVFKRDTVVKWRCGNCGYIHEGAEPPQKCPACDHPRAHFELLAENW